MGCGVNGWGEHRGAGQRPAGVDGWTGGRVDGEPSDPSLTPQEYPALGHSEWTSPRDPSCTPREHPSR